MNEIGSIQWARGIAARMFIDRDFKSHVMDTHGAEAIANIILIIHEYQNNIIPNGRRKKLLIETVNRELSEITMYKTALED